VALQTPERDIVLSPEQLANAPEEVRQWLRSLCGEDERIERGFIFEHNGIATSGDGLAICSPLEIKTLLHMLSDNFLACQVLFELGCEYYNPDTGEHRGHPIRLTDFVQHTDAHDVFETLKCLDAINGALQSLRRDPYATIYRPDGMGGFRVDGRTQQVIYHLWKRLLRLTSSRRAIPLSAGFEPGPGPVEAA
jgi:hypothetical protein